MGRPTAAQIEEMRAQADDWVRLASRSGRAKEQAALPRGQREVFQLRIVLEDCRPPIWRRVLVPASLLLPDLHQVIQLAMGWDNSHLCCFSSGGSADEPSQFGDALQLEADLWLQATGAFVDYARVRLDHLLVKPKHWIRYTYDMGDGWDHRINLEAILVQPLRQALVPRCIGGRRACPPEDCGGAWGYEELLAALANPDHPEHLEQRDWVGAGFDPEAFASEQVNAALQQMQKP